MTELFRELPRDTGGCQQGIGSVADVRFAILETNGKISFLREG
jgi:hypothetical protein